MDFQSNLGVARVSPRLRANISTQLEANLGCPVAFSPFNTLIYTVAGSRIFQTDAGGYPNVAFIPDTSGTAATDYDPNYSDLCQFDDLLWSTSPSKLRSLSGPGGTWTERDTFGSTDEVHKLLYFKKFNRLYYFQNETFINSLGTDYVPADGGDYTLNWEDLVACVDMKPSSNFIWIAGKVENITRSLNGVVWQWDGISAQITQEYQIPNTTGIYALAIDPRTDTPVAMGDNGVLYEFNGNGFSEIGRLPFTTQLPWAGTTPIGSSNQADRFIHPNGMIFTKNGTIQCVINGRNYDSGSTQNENIPSGIWEWSRENGFVHRYSFSYMVTDTIREWGQNQISRAGAIMNANVPNTASGRNGTILAGATLFIDATNTTSVIAYDDSTNTKQKKGYMVTDWFESDEIASAWDIWWMSYRKFLDSTDNITIKYRTTEKASVQGTITWTANNTFTILNSAVNVGNYWTSDTGGEVEIVRGDGGASCAHIINAVNNAGTWTVTLDEAINPAGATSATAIARFQKWIKIFPAESIASPSNWAQFAISPERSEPRIQVKMCFTFTGDGEFYKAILTSNEDIVATK